MSDRQFGSGYSKEPLDGDEAAATRQAVQEWAEARATVQTIQAFVKVGKLAPWIVGIGAAFGAYAASQGWIGGPRP